LHPAIVGQALRLPTKTSASEALALQERITRAPSDPVRVGDLSGLFPPVAPISTQEICFFLKKIAFRG
jgi:hypothetical protein